MPGATQLGLAKRLLERYPWHQFEPHQDWVSPSAGADNVNAMFAAGISGVVRVIYFFDPAFPWRAELRMEVMHIEPNVGYTAFYWNPRNGEEHPLGTVEPDATGAWPIPVQPTMSDWVLVLEHSSPR